MKPSLSPADVQPSRRRHRNNGAAFRSSSLLLLITKFCYYITNLEPLPFFRPNHRSNNMTYIFS